ncbi:MAG: hypothetical protein [Circoviridae sp.]|nr:MAG: hypothetical protein [Circoviridae sp.]
MANPYFSRSTNFQRNKTKQRTVAARRVQRVYRAKRVANPSKVIIKNVKAITTLQNQVNGHVQKNYQVCSFVDPSIYSLKKRTPIAFAANDFTNRASDNAQGGQVFGAIYTGVAPNIEPSAAVIANWDMRTPGLVEGLDSAFHQWKDQNRNRASLKAYQPLYAEYSMTFSRKEQSNLQQPIFIRVDQITTKRRFVNSTYNKYTLPDCLGAFSNMACKDSPKESNAYNPALWSVKTRYIRLAANDITRKPESRTMKLKMAFPKRLLRLNMDPAASATTHEPFNLAVDPKLIKWVIISISNDAGDGTSEVQTNFSRKIVYRDQQGVSA